MNFVEFSLTLVKSQVVYAGSQQIWYNNTIIIFRRDTLNRKWLIPILTVLAIIVGVVGGVMVVNHQQSQYLHQNYQFSHTPTIFVHGWTGGKRSEQQLVDVAESAKVANHVMTIRVKADGKLQIKGHLKRSDRNPIIEVIFINNRAGEVQDAMWLKHMMHRLKVQYHITTYNAVGHSMGAYAWTYYNLMVGDNKAYPKLNKAVLIAGPYDGIINNQKLNQPTKPPLSKLWDDAPNENQSSASGKPKIIRPEFKLLWRLRSKFPKQAKVLNIYGNLKDGSNSDGVITIPSARSLGYLLDNRVASYSEYQVFGPAAQHSKLHRRNPFVDQKLINYLWHK